MAITKATPTIAVQIMANGTPLPEQSHPDIFNTERHVTRYIQALQSQIFEVHCHYQSGMPFEGDCISLQVFVDGEFANCLLLSPKYTACVSKGHVSGCTMLRRYHFALLAMGEDGPQNTNLGIITGERFPTLRKFEAAKRAREGSDKIRREAENERRRQQTRKMRIKLIGLDEDGEMVSEMVMGGDAGALESVLIH